MLKIAKKLDDKQFFLRLNSIPNAEDAIANDVKYHLSCWVTAQRNAQPSIRNNFQELEIIPTVIADIEIIEMVNETISGTNTIIDMKVINSAYNSL